MLDKIHAITISETGFKRVRIYSDGSIDVIQDGVTITLSAETMNRVMAERGRTNDRIAELEAQLAAMEESFQAVRRDRDELEQELLGLKHWQPA